MSNKMNDVAIAITCFNSGLTLPETLDSLLYGNILDGASVILLDGGSTDFTEHIFHYFSSKSDKIRFYLRRFPGVHPAQRVNILIEEGDYDYVFLCHSDDVYIPSAMQDMLLRMRAGSTWAIGSQCGFFQHPIDAAHNKTSPYTGSHCTHPLKPDEIYCEMPFWWCISWNTILLRAKEISNAGIRLNPNDYSYANDYAFNWELVKLGQIENVEYSSVLTRHRMSGDGPVNIDSLSSEGAILRQKIQREIGLEQFLGRHLISVLRSLDYSYGRWNLSSTAYPKSHYLSLATKLHDFSRTSDRFAHMGVLSERLVSELLNGSCFLASP